MKSGFAQGIQRYKCKKCKKHFIEPKIQKKILSEDIDEKDFNQSKVNKSNNLKKSIFNLLKRFLGR